MSGGVGLGERTLSQSAACPAGGFSYKLEITPYANLLPTPPKAPFIGPAARGLPGHRFRSAPVLLPRGPVDRQGEASHPESFVGLGWARAG